MRGSFVLPGTNFFTRPIELSESAWKKDVEILVAEHRALRRVAAGLSLSSQQRRSTLHLLRGASLGDRGRKG